MSKVACNVNECFTLIHPYFERENARESIQLLGTADLHFKYRSHKHMTGPRIVALCFAFAW